MKVRFVFPGITVERSEFSVYAICGMLSAMRRADHYVACRDKNTGIQ